MLSCEAVYCYDLLDGITTGWSVLQTSIELSYISQLHCVVHVAQLKCCMGGPVGTAGGSLGACVHCDQEGCWRTTPSTGEDMQVTLYACIGIWNISVFKTFLTRRRPAEEFSYITSMQLLMQSSAKHGADTSITDPSDTLYSM